MFSNIKPHKHLRIIKLRYIVKMTLKIVQISLNVQEKVNIDILKYLYYYIRLNIEKD